MDRASQQNGNGHGTPCGAKTMHRQILVWVSRPFRGTKGQENGGRKMGKENGGWKVCGWKCRKGVLGEYSVDDVAVNIRQASLNPVMVVGEPFVVDSH